MTAAVAVLALVLSVVVLAATARTARAAARSADAARAAAQQAVAAAERSTGAAGSAAESAAAARAEPAEVVRPGAADHAPPWRLARVSGGRCALHNDGPETELDVEVSGGCVFGGPVRCERLPSDEAVEFSVYDLVGADTGVTVRWSRPGSSERRAWQQPLPPRPR